MKYYHATMDEFLGEYEFKSDFIFMTNLSQHDAERRIESEFRNGAEWDESDNIWVSDPVRWNINGCREISAEDYATLKKYLTELSVPEIAN